MKNLVLPKKESDGEKEMGTERQIGRMADWQNNRVADWENDTLAQGQIGRKTDG